MSDEERRALERRARYSEKLTMFLQCLDEGHVPLTVKGTTRPLFALLFGDEQEPFQTAIQVCGRCQMPYLHPWKKCTGEECVNGDLPTLRAPLQYRECPICHGQGAVPT